MSMRKLGMGYYMLMVPRYMMWHPVTHEQDWDTNKRFNHLVKKYL